MRAIVVEPSGKFREIDLERGNDDAASNLHKLVDGYLEGITLTSNMVAYINEEGKLRSHWENRVAGLFVNKYRDGFIYHDYIAGTFVLTGYNSEGETVDLPDFDGMVAVLEEAGGIRE